MTLHTSINSKSCAIVFLKTQLLLPLKIKESPKNRMF